MWRDASLALSTSLSASCQTDAYGEKNSHPDAPPPASCVKGGTIDIGFTTCSERFDLCANSARTRSSLSESVAHFRNVIPYVKAKIGATFWASFSWTCELCAPHPRCMRKFRCVISLCNVKEHEEKRSMPVAKKNPVLRVFSELFF